MKGTTHFVLTQISFFRKAVGRAHARTSTHHTHTHVSLVENIETFQKNADIKIPSPEIFSHPTCRHQDESGLFGGAHLPSYVSFSAGNGEVLHS